MSRDRVLVHPDILCLEKELGERIAARRAEAGVVPRILVLATTDRQVQRLRGVLAREFGGLLGVEVLTHLTLARRVVEATHDRVPSLARRPLREEITQRLLEARGGSLGDYAGKFPSVVGTLTGLLGELRETGITADDLRAEAARGNERELADLLGDTDRAMEALLAADPPATDRAGLTRLAVDGLATFPAYDEVFQTGAYDLVGMNLELVRAIRSRHGVTWLVPADGEAPSWKFARDFLAGFVAAEPAPLATEEERPFVAAARAFRKRDDAAPTPLPEGSVELVHAQGPEAELTLAARGALRDLGEGLAPDEIGIVARTLEPYASVAESVFDRHGLRVDSSLGLPLSREPRAQAFLTLARALARDFQRQDVIDLTRSGAVDRPKSAAWVPNQWDRLSRRYRLTGGLEAWTRRLPEQVGEERPRSDLREDEDRLRDFEEAKARRVTWVGELARFVGELGAVAAEWPDTGTGAEHAAALQAAGARLIKGWDHDDEVGIRLRGAVEDLASLDAANAAAAVVTDGDTTARIRRKEALEYLERALGETRVTWPGNGVRFLDVMQARGLPFRKLYFVGFNADLVPRRPREDVFLSDATRESVRGATKRPLTVRRHGLDEEHLLHAQTAASVTGRLVLSWQRADAEGKSMAASLALQEWTRLLSGDLTHRERLETERTKGGPWRVPTHPVMNARALAREFDLLSPLEGVLVVAEAAGAASAERVLDFARSCSGLEPESLAPGLALVSGVERYTGGEDRFDALLDPAAGYADRFSPSSLERLAECPQQFFFRYRLRIQALDDTTEDHRLDPLELGLRIHRLLEDVYRALQEVDGSLEERTAFALEQVAAGWERTFSGERDRMAARYPGLWRAMETAWLEELRAFVTKDLASLDEAGLRVENVEPFLSEEITVRLPGDGEDTETFLLEGRLDRVAHGSGRVVVADYKTGGNLENWVKPNPVLRARKLQLPLYTHLARLAYAERPDTDDVAAELIGIGPSFLPASGFVRKGAVRLKDFGKLEAGLEETLGILVRGARAGRFPMNPEEGPCDWCDFRTACRRHHHPSRERVKDHPDLEAFFLVQEKTSRKPLIDDVREARS